MLSRTLVSILCYLSLTHVSFANFQVDQRIVKGQQATPHANPYMAAIIKDDNLYDRCGGAVISNEYILTAAQCVVGYLIDVVLGAHDITAFESQKQKFRVPEKNKIVHPKYKEDTMQNNIALLKLPKKIEFNTFVQKINLAPADSELFIGEKAIFSGWGVNLLHMPDKLQQVELTVVGNNMCKKLRRVEPTEMCAKSFFSLIGLAAKGDAGSPLVLQKENENIVIGIASVRSWLLQFGPSVFTRVSSYRKWIDENMKNGDKSVTSTTKSPVVTTSSTMMVSTAKSEKSEQPEITTAAKADTSPVPQTTGKTEVSGTQPPEGETTNAPPESPAGE